MDLSKCERGLFELFTWGGDRWGLNVCPALSSSVSVRASVFRSLLMGPSPVRKSRKSQTSERDCVDAASSCQREEETQQWHRDPNPAEQFAHTVYYTGAAAAAAAAAHVHPAG